MLTLRASLAGLAVMALGILLMGCSQAPCNYRTLPSDLPGDPEPCTKYCRVWVPPVYRDVPVLVQKSPGCKKEVPEQVLETHYREVCVKPRCTYPVRTPGKRCDLAVIQTRPGGYKWKQDGPDCWRYCYEDPCYEYCNKVVTEEGIEYCMEVPPEYRVEVYHEPVTRYRSVCVPPEWCVEYQKELYRPGHWEWQPTKECESCTCSDPCPPKPCRRSPCRPGTEMVSAGCPRCN